VIHQYLFKKNKSTTAEKRFTFVRGKEEAKNFIYHGFLAFSPSYRQLL